LEDVFRRLDWDKKGLRVDGGYMSNLRFADDTVLISTTKEELIEMLADLKRESGKIGLNRNIDKTVDSRSRRRTIRRTTNRESHGIHIFRTHHNTE